MRNLKKISQNPFGQVLLATLLFCFIFLALFVGLYEAGSVYIIKERSRRAANLTALSGGAVYANGLQLVRESNVLLMAAATYDAVMIGKSIAAALLAPPPLDIGAVVAAAKLADPHKRDGVQKIQENIFGVGKPSGPYPLLIFSEALSSADGNNLAPPPLYFYNYETGTLQNAPIPNMALRFRTLAELLPDEVKASYSLKHDGIRHYFSQDEVEPAQNSRFPNQMRVKKTSSSGFGGWWVRKEDDGADSRGDLFLSRLGPSWALKPLRRFLEGFKLDVTDRDDPPCHTFTLLGLMKDNRGRRGKTFYQFGESRVEAEGIAAWNLFDPIHVNLEKVDLSAFPLLRNALKASGNALNFDQSLKSPGLLDGL